MNKKDDLALMPEVPGSTFHKSPLPLMEALVEKLDGLIKRMEAQGLVSSPPEIKALIDPDENLQVPPEAYEILREVLAYGESKGWKDEWKMMPVMEHLDHALKHITDYQEKGKSYRINHAFARLMFAAVIQHRENIR